MKDIKIFLKKKNTKSVIMLVRGIEIFLKKKKKNVNMVVNDIRIYRMSIENIFPECRKLRLFEYKSILRKVYKICLGLGLKKYIKFFFRVFFFFGGWGVFKLGLENVLCYCIFH